MQNSSIPSSGSFGPLSPYINPYLPAADSDTTQRRIHRVAMTWLLRKPNRFEALAWLRKEVGGKTNRSLGHFRNVRDGANSQAARFVEDLYRAGATEVIVPDVYRNKA